MVRATVHLLPGRALPTGERVLPGAERSDGYWLYGAHGVPDSAVAHIEDIETGWPDVPLPDPAKREEWLGGDVPDPPRAKRKGR